jgi:hypothetical protein
VPAIVWRICLICPLLLLAGFSSALIFIFHNALPGWMLWQMPVGVVAAILLLLPHRNFKPAQCAGFAVGVALCSLMVVVAELPRFETNLRDNQTLQPLGDALQENYRTGDAVVCWGRFPQGLPFYTDSVISATNRPYFGGMDLTLVPFEFPGNRDRLGDLLLPDDNALAKLLAGNRRVWIVSFGDEVQKIQQVRAATPLHLVTTVGRWELFVNR